ncbi:metal ABC transporter permease [Oscillochloris sp. ZM17-4]|uniref:metal ABC transporter permease n=1 Tax=Oscillochloris sp. ZM17-4 TaxID=2866714 RepID=UPI001C72AD45|nr:metal ABC transporter permease [Oscillochloris sp. ZM17-4]MBX0328172.1 metal ABC transporter permease [Oscillochloris sp. ZM17-4]
MFDLITAPLAYSFMQRGLLAAVMVGVVCAVVGTYVVLRGMAFFGDALSHTILPGIAAGYLLNGGDRGALFWWALGTAVASSLGIGAISRGSRLREDTAIGVVFAGMFALGIAMISTVRSYSADLTHFLFGDVLGVSDGDLLRIAIFGGLILLTVALLYKELTLISFDSVLATTLRLPVQALEYLLLVLIAVAVVVSIQTVGVSLMLAVLVTPAATASLLTRRLMPMLLLAAGMAAICGVVGLYLSYYLGVASGAAIVLTCTAIFLITWAGKAIVDCRLQIAD